VSEERLQKILARAGVASRRKAEELIREGRVTVNGQPAAIGDKADLARDSVRLDERRIQAPATHRYLLLNKPRGVMSTVSDPAGRTTVIDLVPPAMRRALAPVGRLDFQTEGLLLLTDDGELAQQVAHPSFGCWKTYEVKVRGRPEAEQIERLRAGIVLEGRRTAPCRIAALRRSSKSPPAAVRRARAGGGPGGPGAPGRRGRQRAVPDSDNASWWSVELGEGRTRQIREMFQRIGHPVQKLRRVAIGPVSDPHLPVGSLRELSEREVAALRKARPPARHAGAAGGAQAKAGKPQGLGGKRADAADRPAKRPRERPPEGTAKRPAKRSRERPPEHPATRPRERPSERPPEHPATRPRERPLERSPRRQPERPPDRPRKRPPERPKSGPRPGGGPGGRGALPGGQQHRRGGGASTAPAPRRAGRRDGSPGPRAGGRGSAPSGPRRRPDGRGRPASPGGRRRT